MVSFKLFALPTLLLLPGCAVASAAVDLATAPVRVVKTGSTVVDVMTTSQSEKDQKRGQEIRRREERLGELQREYRKQAAKCGRGNDEACRKADQAYTAIRAQMPGVPYEGR